MGHVGEMAVTCWWGISVVCWVYDWWDMLDKGVLTCLGKVVTSSREAVGTCWLVVVSNVAGDWV